MFKILETIGVNGKHLRLLTNLHKEQTPTIRIEN